jgi:hypothetical protein
LGTGTRNYITGGVITLEMMEPVPSETRAVAITVLPGHVRRLYTPTPFGHVPWKLRSVSSQGHPAQLPHDGTAQPTCCGFYETTEGILETPIL